MRAKSGQDQVFGQTGPGLGDEHEIEVARVLVAKEDPGQEQQAAENMHQQIAVPGGRGSGGLAGPDQKHRSEGHHFPEDEDGQVIAGEGHPQGTADVKAGGHGLAVVLHVETVEEAQERHEGEDVGEDQAQFVHPADHDFETQVLETPVDSGGHLQDLVKSIGRQGQQVNLLETARQEGDQKGPQDIQQSGMDPAIHKNPPAVRE